MGQILREPWLRIALDKSRGDEIEQKNMRQAQILNYNSVASTCLLSDGFHTVPGRILDKKFMEHGPEIILGCMISCQKAKFRLEDDLSGFVIDLQAIDYVGGNSFPHRYPIDIHSCSEVQSLLNQFIKEFGMGHISATQQQALDVAEFEGEPENRQLPLSQTVEGANDSSSRQSIRKVVRDGDFEDVDEDLDLVDVEDEDMLGPSQRSRSAAKGTESAGAGSSKCSVQIAGKAGIENFQGEERDSERKEGVDGNVEKEGDRWEEGQADNEDCLEVASEGVYDDSEMTQMESHSQILFENFSLLMEEKSQPTVNDGPCTQSFGFESQGKSLTDGFDTEDEDERRTGGELGGCTRGRAGAILFTQLDATETQEDNVTLCPEILRDTNVGNFGNCSSSKLELKCTPIFKSGLEMGTPPTTHRSSQSQSQRSGHSQSQDDEDSSWANAAQNAKTTNKSSKSQGQKDVKADGAMAALGAKTMITISESQGQEDEDTARTDAERVGKSKGYSLQDKYHSNASSGISSRLQLEAGVSKAAHPVARTESGISESDSCPFVAKREARQLETQKRNDSPLSDVSIVHENPQGSSQSESPNGSQGGGRRLGNISRIDETSALLDSRDVVKCSNTPQIRGCVNLTRRSETPDVLRRKETPEMSLVSETPNVRRRKETSETSLVSDKPNVRQEECASGVSCLFRSPNTQSMQGNSSCAHPCTTAESSEISYSAVIKIDDERSEYIEELDRTITLIRHEQQTYSPADQKRRAMIRLQALDMQMLRDEIEQQRILAMNAEAEMQKNTTAVSKRLSGIKREREDE